MESSKNKQVIVIITLSALLCLSLAIVTCLSAADHPTAILAETNNSLEDPDETGKIRVKMNTCINVYENTMQDIDFFNLNKNRFMKLKIVIEDEEIYESSYIAEGEVLEADLIDVKALKKGENNALAEVYSYTLNKELIGQRNVEITLNNIN